jgi:hypothetical protein
MKILNEDDIKTIPMGDKLYPVLVKLRLFWNFLQFVLLNLK